MSVIFTEQNCSLISHKTYIDQAYGQHDESTNTTKSYRLNPSLFDINTCFLRSNQSFNNELPNSSSNIKSNKRKRRKNCDVNTNLQSLIQSIAHRTKDFIEKCKVLNYLPTKSTTENDITSSSNDAAQALSQSIYSDCNKIETATTTINGQNSSTIAVVTELNGTQYIIPPKCKFTSGDIGNLEKYATELYDFIVIDPPWLNKYIKRVKRKSCGYQMCNEDEIAAIPIENLIKSNSLVVIWCTNSPAHIDALKNKFLKKWNLKLLATWYWIKITKYGDTVCAFDLPLRKQPFEQIFISAHIASTENQFNDIPDEHCIVSIPSAIHSQKPPLTDLFRSYLPANPNCLELFARYLLPGYTSFGLEVLKLQNIKLFTEN